MDLNIKVNKPQESENKYEALPEGWYHVVVIDSKSKETRAGTGKYLEITLEVIGDTPHAGRWVWDRFNLVNPNPRAVEIAQENLEKLAYCAGLDHVGNSIELHHRPVQALIKQREWEGQLQNEVKGWRKADMDSASTKTAVSDSTNVPF